MEIYHVFQWKSIITKICSSEVEPIAKSCLFKWIRWSFNQCDTASFHDEIKLLEEALFGVGCLMEKSLR
jgi:hypothetical protein